MLMLKIKVKSITDIMPKPPVRPAEQPDTGNTFKIKFKPLLATAVSLRPFRQLPRDNVFVAMLLFAVLGSYFILAGRAASPVVSVEPESGAVSGSAKVTDDANASGGRAITFAAAADVSAPAGLQVFTGGDSIALTWNPGGGTVPAASYKVYRDGTLLATTTPGGTLPAYAKGTRYIDAGTAAGRTYSYQVQAVSAAGQQSALSASLSISTPSSTTPVPTITVDASQAPDTGQWLTTVVVPELKVWYPKISDKLAFAAYTPRTSLTIQVIPGLANVGEAWAETGLIKVQAEYIRTHPEDMWMFVHEATHILQAAAAQTPAWIQEGTATWASDYYYLPKNLPMPGRSHDHYTQGYSNAAHLLDWIQAQGRPNFVRNLNIAAHNGTYTPSFFTSRTGRSADQHWTAMTGRSSVTGTIKSRSFSTKCVDDRSSSTANGNPIQLWGCNNTAAQSWSKLTDADGSVFFLVFGKCMDVTGSGTADGTPVQLWDCNGTNAQKWRAATNGTIVNVISNKCLYGANAPDGTQLTIKTCSASDAGQLWTAP